MQSTPEYAARDTAENTNAVVALSPALAITASKSPSGYVFPPIYSFPAFFTRQLNATTFASQSRQWHSLILSFCRWHRVFRIDLSEASLTRELGDVNSTLWSNAAIHRRAKPDFILELIHGLVKSGSAMYDPPTKYSGSSIPSLPKGTTAVMLWRSVDEWATAIYTWVSDSGLTGTIMTMYEVQETGVSKDFCDLPLPLLRLALLALVKQNKAQILQASQAGDGEGVKFF